MDYAPRRAASGTDTDSDSDGIFEDNDTGSPLALILLYSRPDPHLLSESFNTLWACQRGADEDFRVIPVSAIISVVSIRPMPYTPEDQEKLYFVIEKSGLEDIPVNVDVDVDNIDT